MSPQTRSSSHHGVMLLDRGSYLPSGGKRHTLPDYRVLCDRQSSIHTSPSPPTLVPTPSSHDLLAYPLLVRLHRFGQRVSGRTGMLYSSSDSDFSLVHVLASGVFLSGFIKDWLCLPRPLSPPLSRISMSPSVSLEYGFPSTHSTNAVSVVVYFVFLLRSASSDVNATVRVTLEVVSYLYAISIVLGRLYCGMHGFLDVIIGGILGALLSLMQCFYGVSLTNSCSKERL